MGTKGRSARPLSSARVRPWSHLAMSAHELALASTTTARRSEATCVGCRRARRGDLRHRACRPPRLPATPPGAHRGTVAPPGCARRDGDLRGERRHEEEAWRRQEVARLNCEQEHSRRSTPRRFPATPMQVQIPPPPKKPPMQAAGLGGGESGGARRREGGRKGTALRGGRARRGKLRAGPRRRGLGHNSRHTTLGRHGGVRLAVARLGLRLLLGGAVPAAAPGQQRLRRGLLLVLLHGVEVGGYVERPERERSRGLCG